MRRSVDGRKPTLQWFNYAKTIKMWCVTVNHISNEH